MDSSMALLDDQLEPPPRIFERLRQIAGYAWDEAQRPYHSTYDNWHVFGTRFVSPYSSSGTPSRDITSPPAFSSKLSSSSSIPQSDGSSDRSAASPPIVTHVNSDLSNVEEIPVVARVSYHVLREERAFHTCKNLIATADPHGEHNVKPIDLIRLTSHHGDRGSIVVGIYEFAGHNHLFDVLDLGPAFYYGKKVEDRFEADIKGDFRLGRPISLQHFLDFAIGATQCLEILHHGHGTVHGEIRGDAFHFDIGTNKVKLTSFGSGVRSFENGLTSSGWSMLSKELGAKNKLLYISPEQTGRLPAEPDTRTDIYSLGVLFWQLLTQQPVFTGATPLDIVQCVLGRRIPLVSNVRIDVPEVLGKIIQKCTAKDIRDRYHSVSGLQYDLQMVQRFLVDGDQMALKAWHIASRDVSSFFILPTSMVGRSAERDQLFQIIERVARTHELMTSTNNRFSEASGFSNDLLDTADVSSEGASSVEGAAGNRRSGSFTQTVMGDSRLSRASFQPSLNGTDELTMSGDTVSSGNSGPRLAKPWERNHSVSLETRSLIDSFSDRQQSRHSAVESVTSLSRQLGSARFRRRGHCEVVTIEGAGGLGKSFLVQQVLADARRRGYCATSKFDTARRYAFGPLLKLLSSLIKQAWGERNTETPFHSALKDYLRPLWPVLHKTLGLPEFLLGAHKAAVATISRSASTAQSPSKGQHARSSLRRRGSSPGSSPSGLSYPKSPRVTSQSSQDFLRAGGTTKTIRLMNTFLDILRIFSSYHFICFCLDDLHFADSESLELITQMIAARLKMVVIITFRPDEIAPEMVQRVLQPADHEEHPKSSGPRITRIVLSPLNEKEILQFVASTICRPPEDAAPLALVIQSKTAGNPFYMREMLHACYRSKCIWYDHRENRWCYDLDLLFEQFKGEHGYDVLDNDFITRRLSELPSIARAILAWASLLGNSFSFDLICQLLSGEFDFVDETCSTDKALLPSRYSKQAAVGGLQAAVQACILVQGDTDERFRFAHDRYVQAASSLKECNEQKQHFIIAQTLLKYHGSEPRWRENIASHICKSVNLIKHRIPNRGQYRKHLMDCGASAVENGARPTAAKYYAAAIELLQPEPWVSGEDSSYAETLELYMRSAECNVFMNESKAAYEYVNTIFDKAKTPADMAPAWLLKSRIEAQSGDSVSALATLKDSLLQLNVDFDAQPTFEKCDAEFMRLTTRIMSMDRSKVMNLPSIDPSLVVVGAILADACSASFWSDCLDFFNLSLTMLRIHLERGSFPQSGMALLHIGFISISRFNMIEFGVEMGNRCLELFGRLKDPFSSARGYMIYGLWISHVQVPINLMVNQFEQLVEYAASAGDRISVILSFGLSAQMRFFASENYADLEAICQYCCEEVTGWAQDTRGGTFLIVVRQVARALQGKTKHWNPLEVLSDDQHSSSGYKSWLTQSTHNGGRSLLVYETMEIIPLYLFGHFEKACEVGQRCIDNMQLIWSARNTRTAMLFYGLSLAGLMFRKLQDPCNQDQDLRSDVQATILVLDDLNKRIKDWQVVSAVNYLVWTKWLDAQIAELKQDHGFAIEQYETALDHAAEYSFTFEEALGNFLMAGFFIRRSARRSARAVLRESVGLWQQLGAAGMANQIEEEHSLLLHGPNAGTRTVEVGVQTEFATDMNYPENEEMTQQANQPTPNELRETRMAAWRGSIPAQSGAGLPALDMIDLHAILVSSQVISSVLQVDVLLKTMCDVVLQTCGGSATQAAIIVQDQELGEDAYCIAASGEPERGAVSYPPPGKPLAGTSLVAENVIHYCVRFQVNEAVFIPDLIQDERFGNVSEGWLRRNPLSKTVIALPIRYGSKPLLGVLYLEGEPGTFTSRHLTVLQLLVQQIGISYSNALAIRNIEKVSAENEAMIKMQKEALAAAKAAELKAKEAEAKALRNVKIAEEAAKAKNVFLANVSHELRTPLNGVIGNSELLRDSNLNRDQLEMAESIRVSADLLLTVINDILDFSKMEADKMKLYIIAFNPEEMVREVVRAVSYSNREKTSTKNVKIIQDIHLPPMLIYGDPIRLHQVLGNLIGNSLKFTEDGSITIGARVDSETQEHTKLTFWVRDTGIGIPPQQLTKLFQPFSQADASTARKYGGSGLGLSICKSLIETMMHGQIELDSEEGVGTTAWFCVTFDKAKPEVSAGDVQQIHMPQIIDKQQTFREPPREPPSNPYMDLTQIPKDQLRVCIAEDNLINQKIAIQYIRKLGYTKVDAYENGLKAVEGLREQAAKGSPYHVVLMDVQMPVLDGYEATKLIRRDVSEEVKKVLVIAMTASAIQGDREKCLAAGMNDYLAKPVKADLLKRKLDMYTTVQGVMPPPSPPVRHSPSSMASKARTQSADSAMSPPTTSSSPGSLTDVSPGQSPGVSSRASTGPTQPPQPPPPQLPPHASSDNRSLISERSSIAESTASMTPSQKELKRQPNKLTKMRNNSEKSDKSEKTEKPKGVLRKHRPSSTISLGEQLAGTSQDNFSDEALGRPPSLNSTSSLGNKGTAFK
ncbi:hsp90-like protein [Truncatella angustata]|uniref:histidine kinase n=1 Tax=Truncatella angustata TaxID=152316 RepID=A0A9P8ZYZ7_9PEZI|nr:hsp90-like protein [Truncatella angustata]KAH6656642.1 hsp90-like protein [Truncatella angustata]